MTHVRGTDFVLLLWNSYKCACASTITVELPNWKTSMFTTSALETTRILHNASFPRLYCLVQIRQDASFQAQISRIRARSIHFMSQFDWINLKFHWKFSKKNFEWPEDNVQPHEVFSKANYCWSVQLSRSEFLLPEETSPSFQSLLEVTSSLPDHPHNHFFLLGRHCPTRGHGKYCRKSERKIPSPESQQVDVSLDKIVNHTNY